MKTADFLNLTPLYESSSTEKGQDVYKNAMQKLKPVFVDEYDKDVKFELYNLNNMYEIVIHPNYAIGYFPNIMLLNKEFKEIKI